MITIAKILHFYEIWLHINMVLFPEDMIFMGLILPFSFWRRGWEMRPKPDLTPAVGVPCFCHQG
jgi:hypothetical protein